MTAGDRFARAQDFIWRNARLLERQLFAYVFAQGPKEPVLAALRAYQNDDGGFGNALEPDKRCPASQPVDVEMALRVLDEVDGFDDPMVARSCDWLGTIIKPDGALPWALPSANAYPHAEWWEVAEDPPSSLTLTAGIAALLLKHGIQPRWLERAIGYLWREIETTDARDFDTLIRVIGFLEHVPDRTRAGEALQKVLDHVAEPGVVALDPDAGGYVHKPLDWAPTPQSTCRPLFSDDVIATHLQALAARQQPDGGWPIWWETISPAVELEWRGRVTIEALRTLQAYGV